MSVERNFNETFVARLSSREKQMQQGYWPVISVHKWFARRPGALFRALALAEFVDERVERSYTRGHELAGVCLDAFMGGGTPAFESSRLGLSVIGYDTNPMARWIVERELEDVDPAQLCEVGGGSPPTSSVRCARFTAPPARYARPTPRPVTSCGCAIIAAPVGWSIRCSPTRCWCRRGCVGIHARCTCVPPA